MSCFSCNFAYAKQQAKCIPAQRQLTRLYHRSTLPFPYKYRTCYFCLKGYDPFTLKGCDPFALKGCDPFAQRGATLLPKGVRPFCLKGVRPFCLKGVRPFCPKGCDPFAQRGATPCTFHMHRVIVNALSPIHTQPDIPCQGGHSTCKYHAKEKKHREGWLNIFNVLLAEVDAKASRTELT